VGKSRYTRQKEIIQEKIHSLKSFFTAEELHEKISDEKIGIATVYRYLKELREQMKIFFYACDNKLIYSTQNKSHCHYVCEKTGKIKHIQIDNLDFLKNKIPGSITSFQIEVKGVCDNDKC